MTDLLYLRYSTDKQTNARRLHAPAALIASGAARYEDPATSSRVFAVDQRGRTSGANRFSNWPSARMAR